MKKNRNNNYMAATVTSLLLHSALIGALLWGAQVTRTVYQPAGEIIKAVVVDPEAVREQARKIREQRSQVRRKEDERLQRIEQQAERLKKQREQEERRLRELKSQRLVSEKAAREAEKEQKRLTQAKQKAEKSARLAKEAAEKADRQHKLAQKQRAEFDAKREEKERQRKLAQKKKAKNEARKAEIARKETERKAADLKRQQRKEREQEAALDDIFIALESESASRTSAKGQFINDEAKLWAGKFESMIQQNWLIDSSMNGQTCRLKLRLAADGFVIDVSTLSGDSALCRSATASVFKVNKFPMPSDPDVVVKLRDLHLNFER